MIVLLVLIILIDTFSSTQIEQSPKHFKIYENSPNGTIVGAIETYPSNYLLTLMDNADGRFFLNSKGQLLTIDQSRLNYEEQNQYQIRIQFSNQSELFQENFFIDIEDINEPPYNLQCPNQTGYCTALDEDFNQTLKFQLKTIQNLDYEIICTDNGQPPLSVSTWIKVLPDDMTLVFVPIHSLIIPVDDDNNNNNNNKIDNERRDNIVILYSNDGDKTERQRRQANSPPQDIYFNMFFLTVPENSRDFEIANVYVIDEDNDNYTCSMYTYNTSEDRQPFEIQNGILRTSLTMHNNNYDLDFETVPVYDMTVTCYDPIHHFTIAKNFSINVTDVNEAPVELELIPNTLPENSITGYVIGQFHTVDPDIFAINQTFDYRIVTDPNGIFRIENDQLILTRDNDVEMCISQPDLCPHDYEQIGVLYVRIRVEDNGKPPASQKFWIQIKLTDENDPPVNLQLDANLVKENSAVGTLIGLFSVRDQDLYQTHTFRLLNENPLSTHGNLFFIEDNSLRLARSPDYEQEQFVLITVQATDNGTIPKSVTNDFLIEIVDVDELPNTYIFIPSSDSVISNNTINDLINGKQPVRTVYLPQNAYFQSSLGRIVFLMEDRDRDINLNGYNDTTQNELGFSKPTCEGLTEVPYRLLCTSIVTVAQPRSVDDNNDGDGHLVTTPLVLTSNEKTMTFPKPLRLKFENITLTMDDKPTESIDIPKQNSSSFQIGTIHAVDLAAAGQPVANVTLNSNNSLSYPLEIVNSTILKIRDGVNFSSINGSSKFNVSVLVTTQGEDSRIIEKYLVVNVKDKADFNLTLSNNKIMENSHENTSLGNFLLEDGIGNYIIDLVDDANGRFKLNGTNLLTTTKYIEYCHINRTCPLDHETEPIINLTIAVRDPSTNATLRLMKFPIEIRDENESPYNLTLSTRSISENTTIGSVVGLIDAIDDDLNQTLTYTTNNPTFNIVNNQLILQTKLSYDKRQFIPLVIRATDNGHPTLFTEKLFIINITAVNRPPINVTSTPMIVYLPQNTNSTPIVVGQIRIIDPDVNENFTIKFNQLNFRALTPATNSYSMIADDGYVVSSQIYNISIVDLTPPVGLDKVDYLLNVTANITDSANHSISHEFFIRYIPRSITNSTIISTIPPTTTTTGSLSQALHIRIYETTPPNTPIIRGLLTSSSISNNSLSNTPICTATDNQNSPFPINTTHSVFIIHLPDNYTLNSTNRSTILMNVQCNIANGTNVNQDIVINVLPAPPTVQINFNQTKPFDATNNDTILGTVSSIELTTTPTNRTYNLSLINNQDIFQLLPNGSLIQIAPYPSNFLLFDNPSVNLTIQAIETTPNEPVRIIQTIFNIPIIVNSSTPSITFSRTSIPNDINPNTIIGNLTAHNITTPYRLQLVDTYENGLELDPNTQTITLKRAVTTLPLINNQTQLPIKVRLMNQTNGTIFSTIFPLTITYPIVLDPCLNKDCGNGTCIHLNETSSYCLCTGGYRGIDCRITDSCAYNPCANDGVCQQLSSTGDFVCQCLPNHSGLRCQTLTDVCQVNTSSCPSTDICVPINNNLTNFFTCISKDKLQYFVFDYLNDYRTIDVINDQNLPKKIGDFMKNNLFPMENIVLSDRKMLGPEKYDRAELISVAVPLSNTTLNNALERFCMNQSSMSNFDSFAREICAGYQQAIYLNEYFKSTPNFCPNCSFVDAADKYYWFDNVIPFFPLWITLIAGSLLMAAIPLIPSSFNAPKKVVLPLMKAKMHPEDEDATTSVLAKSVRSAGKISRSSPRERNDSGYESNEETENYLEQIINNYQHQQQQFHVYPLLHGPRSPRIERRGTTIDDFISSNVPPSSRSRNFSQIPQRSIQRSVSMSAQKTRRQSSIGHSQTLKPIIQRRSTLFPPSIESLIRLTGTPRLNDDDETYLPTRFRNENTSKFVIGTLWNTFALVNNLFLQRARKRRDAISEENIQADQLAHLQELYSLARDDQDQEVSTNNVQSIITQTLLEPETNNLQSIILDIFSSKEEHRCTCYGNHHVPSCGYYDHSLPYIKRYIENTSELEKLFDDIQKSNQPKHQDATTQSYLEKPKRAFTHFRLTNNAATQSSPISTLRQLHSHVSTQYSPTGNKTNISTQFNLDKSNDEYNHHYINIATQTTDHKTNNFNNISTQFSPRALEYMNILPPLPTNNHTYINTSTQFSPTANEDVSTQYSPEEIKPKKLTTSIPFNPKIIEDNNIYDRRKSLMNELKQALTSSTPLSQIINEEQKSLPNHTVRSLVSMFETTSPVKKSNLILQQKSTITNPKILTPPEPTLLNISTEEIHSSIVDDTIELYANEIASNIVDNALLTATTTTLYHNEQSQRRFSFYKNGGGHGKSLLFQANTFVPSNRIAEQEMDQNLRAESRSSSALLINPIPSTVPIDTENESRHTLIVGRYVDGNESTRLKSKQRSLTLDTRFDLESASSSDDEQINHQQFLSNSELVSAQQLYIRPWLVRRSTAPDIHCLTNDITDTRVQIQNSSDTFFTIFPNNNNHHLDFYTRFTCLITILVYLRDVHDDHSNRVLYDQIQQIEKEFFNPTSTIPSKMHSNVFQTINSDGSKRYRTGFILDINSSELINKRTILAQQIEWKRVKIVVRRFRKKYRYYKRLMKHDEKIDSTQLNLENYFKYFDSTSKRRIKKYAKHYAEKL